MANGEQEKVTEPDVGTGEAFALEVQEPNPPEGTTQPAPTPMSDAELIERLEALGESLEEMKELLATADAELKKSLAKWEGECHGRFDLERGEWERRLKKLYAEHEALSEKVKGWLNTAGSEIGSAKAKLEGLKDKVAAVVEVNKVHGERLDALERKVEALAKPKTERRDDRPQGRPNDRPNGDRRR